MASWHSQQVVPPRDSGVSEEDEIEMAIRLSMQEGRAQPPCQRSHTQDDDDDALAAALAASLSTHQQQPQGSMVRVASGLQASDLEEEEALQLAMEQSLRESGGSTLPGAGSSIAALKAAQAEQMAQATKQAHFGSAGAQSSQDLFDLALNAQGGNLLQPQAYAQPDFLAPGANLAALQAGQKARDAELLRSHMRPAKPTGLEDIMLLTDALPSPTSNRSPAPPFESASPFENFPSVPASAPAPTSATPAPPAAHQPTAAASIPPPPGPPFQTAPIPPPANAPPPAVPAPAAVLPPPAVPAPAFAPPPPISAQATEPEEAPDEYLCPITCEIMEDPVFATDGHTYERSAIEAWLQKHSTSPKTGEELPAKMLIPNYALKSLIQDWCDTHPDA